MPAVFFDFDGVIADTFAGCAAIIAQDGKDAPAERLRRLFHGNVLEAKDSPSRNGGGERFWQDYAAAVGVAAPFAGVPAALSDLAADYPLAIVSSGSGDAIAAFLDRHGLRGFFQEIAGRETHSSKIHKLRALRDIYAPSAPCLLVTDTLGDLLESAKAGVPALAVTWGYHDEATLASGEPIAFAREPESLPRTVRSLFMH